jgi:hypothetical protein
MFKKVVVKSLDLYNEDVARAGLLNGSAQMKESPNCVIHIWSQYSRLYLLNDFFYLYPFPADVANKRRLGSASMSPFGDLTG